MELLAACQGMEFLKPLKSTAPLQKVYDLVRSVSPWVHLLFKLNLKFSSLDEDRYMQPEIQEVIQLVRDNRIWEVVAPHLEV
jgi:histidine ammonia-lyase